MCGCGYRYNYTWRFIFVLFSSPLSFQFFFSVCVTQVVETLSNVGEWVARQYDLESTKRSTTKLSFRVCVYISWWWLALCANDCVLRFTFLVLVHTTCGIWIGANKAMTQVKWNDMGEINESKLLVFPRLLLLRLFRFFSSKYSSREHTHTQIVNEVSTQSKSINNQPM